MILQKMKKVRGVLVVESLIGNSGNLEDDSLLYR